MAGVAVVLTILASAIVAGYESVDRIFHPAEVNYLGAVAAASMIGFLGNEGVAFQIAKEVRHQLLHHLKHLGDVIVHIDPEDKVGETHHHILEHTHDGLHLHSH